MIVLESPVKSMTSQLQSCTLDDCIEALELSNDEVTTDYITGRNTLDVIGHDNNETTDKNGEPMKTRVSPLKRDRPVTRAKVVLRTNEESSLKPTERSIKEKYLVSPKKKIKSLEADEKQANDAQNRSANQNSQKGPTNQLSGKGSSVQAKRSLKFENLKNETNSHETKSKDDNIEDLSLQSQDVKESFENDDNNRSKELNSKSKDLPLVVISSDDSQDNQVFIENKLHQKAKNLKARRSKSVDLFGNQVDLSSEITDSKLTQQNRSTKGRKGRKQKSIDDLSIANSKVTDFYQYRRSDRRLGGKIWTKEDIYEKLVKENCQDGLKIVTFAEKGRGIVATKTFERNDFVVEYKGDLITPQEAKIREEKFENNPDIGCYMYYFVHGGIRYCIDATRELGIYGYGRLLNHSRKKANCRTKSITVDGQAKLILIANRTISEGEEMLYDYGDRSKTALTNHPWLAQ